MTPDPAPPPRRFAGLFAVTRLGLLLIFVGHMLACVGVVALMGRGFAWNSWSFVGYRVLPILTAALLIAAMVPRWRLERVAVAALLGAWLATGIAVAIAFPQTGPRLALVCAGASVVLALAFRATLAVPHLRAWIAAGIGTLASVPTVALLAAPPVSTRPIHGIAERVIASGDAERLNLRLDGSDSGGVSFDTAGATLTVTRGRRVIYIEPLLTFNQRSPDGCWTIFASRADRVPPFRRLLATLRAPDRVDATYVDEDRGVAIGQQRLSVWRDAGAVRLDATATLSRAIYTHLNTYTQLTIAGQKQLKLRFSPTPDVPIDVRDAGYPTGKPARFAYLDANQTFHVVEATDAEKGPFKTLASGKLDGPLTITLLEGDDEILSMTFDDWASEASTAPSPSAGYGIPQNTIEFSLDSDRPGAAATLFISLASTSVGRGWQSVGHAAGQYRNRLTVSWPAP